MTSTEVQTERVIAPARNILGSLRLPGDKSISHRYALLGGLAHGKTRLTNFSTGADCASSLNCVAALGAKVTEIPHEDPAASVLPHPFTAVKSPAGELTIEVPMPVNGNPPVFEIVTVIGAETCPCTVEGKLSVVVEIVSIGPDTPVPLSTAACEPMLSLTAKLPAATPAAVGANVTVTAHPTPAASELPQVLAPFKNGDVAKIEVIETVLPPTF